METASGRRRRAGGEEWTETASGRRRADGDGEWMETQCLIKSNIPFKYNYSIYVSICGVTEVSVRGW